MSDDPDTTTIIVRKMPRALWQAVKAEALRREMSLQEFVKLAVREQLRPEDEP